MGLIATEPLLIGDRVRQPGYELTEEDMAGRNIGMLKRHGKVKWVDEAPRRGRPRREPADDDE